MLFIVPIILIHLEYFTLCIRMKQEMIDAVVRGFEFLYFKRYHDRKLNFTSYSLTC